jgi:hypothetical protein
MIHTCDLEEDGNVLLNFFQEKKTQTFELSVEANSHEIMESLRIFIDRNGRPFNFLKSEPVLALEREKYLTQIEQETNLTHISHETKYFRSFSYF